MSFTSSSPSSPEVDPLAPQQHTSLLSSPSRRLGAIAGLLSGGLAVTIGMLVAALGNVASPIDAVGSSFIDRTPPWLKTLAIYLFGTDNKTALRVGIVLLLATIAYIAGSFSIKSPTPLISAIVIFAFLGALSAIEQEGSNSASILAPIVGAVVGIGSALRLLGILANRWLAKSTPSPSRVPLGWDRRRFMRATAAVGATAVTAGLIGQSKERQRISAIESQRPDSLPPVSESLPPSQISQDISFITPNDDFYRIDTALSFPNVNLEKWKLRIHGLVDQEITLSYADIAAMPQVEKVITICCVSNEIGGPYIGNAVWQGVYLKDLLLQAGVKPEAEQLFSRSLDGWTCGFPIEIALDGRDALLAIGMNGEPLPLEHGFPARLIVPGIYGYVSATKWLSEIEINKWSDEAGYWIPRGWAREAPIKTQSRIDVPRAGATVKAGPTRVAGVAWAQHTGIEKVEVRIDTDEWNEAVLGDDISDDTWRLWTFDWRATPGQHIIQVRATDKSGYTQTETVTDVAPDGATGWHTREVSAV
jgi:DMSO/TMAO reductase YedYZ molybdopterin-dependent catalytic subunit